MQRTTIAKKNVFFILQYSIQVVVEKLSFSPVFESNKSRFSLFKLPSSGNNLSDYTEGSSAAWYFLEKLARCGYFVLLKFHQFKTLSSSVSKFKFSVAKEPFISVLISWSIESCCLIFCIAVFDFIERIVSWKLLRIKIYRGLWFWFL